MKKVIALFFILSVFLMPATALGKKGGEKESLPLSELSWDQTVEAAKKEGKVVWFQWYFQPSFREFVAPFEKKYGIKVTIPDGSLEANKNKLISEKKRKTGDIDVLALTSGSYSTLDPAQFFLGPINKLIPGGKKLTTVKEGVDSKGYGVAFWGNQTGLAYDSEKIDFSDLPQTYEELAAWIKKNPKKFGFNVENGGSGPSFVQSVVRGTVKDINFNDGSSSPEKTKKLAPAWKWFDAKKGQYVITASNADSLTRLNDQEFLLVPAWEDHLAGLQKKNEIKKRVKFYIPEFGMNGGGNMVSIPRNAPHKAAALVFITWLTSAETQSELNRVFGAAPQHPDAGGEFALVPMEQRAYSTRWFPEPFATDVKNAFRKNVVLK